MNLFRTTFVILLVVVMAGFSTSYAAVNPVENTKADVKTNDSEILKSLTAPESVVAEEDREATPSIVVEDMMIGSPTATVEVPPAMPLPSKELLLSLINTVDNDEFEDKLIELDKQYLIDQAKTREWHAQMLEEQRALNEEYEKCSKGDIKGLGMLAVASEDVFLNFHICKKLAKGNAVCNNIKNVDKNIYQACVKDNRDLMFYTEFLPVAAAPGSTESDLMEQSKKICDSVAESERPKDCVGEVAVMMKTINTSIFGKDKTSCEAINSVAYKEYCEAMFNGDFLYCKSPERSMFSLCRDRFLERLLAIVEKDRKLLDSTKESNDLNDLLAAWYINKSSCEYYAGSYSDKYCDVLKAITINASSDEFTNWISQNSLPE